MSNIRQMPLVSFPSTVGNNEHWEDNWAYLDAAGNPISGAGIDLELMVRETASSASPLLVGVSTGAAILNGVTVNGGLSWGGAGGNVITLDFAPAVMVLLPAGVYVAEVQGVAETRRTLALITLTINEGVVR